MKLPSLALLLALISCSGSALPPASADNHADEAPTRCAVQPALAAKATPTPKALGCTNRAALAAATEGCNQGDPVQCYLVGVCFAAEISMIGDKDPSRRAGAVAQGKKAFRVACDGGIADGCSVRADLFEDQQTNPASRKEACEDVVRGCNLGRLVNCTECTLFCQ